MHLVVVVGLALPAAGYAQSQSREAVIVSKSGALNLKSAAALVVDQNGQRVLYAKNVESVVPIASITKLMTALVVLDAGLPLE